MLFSKGNCPHTLVSLVPGNHYQVYNNGTLVLGEYFVLDEMRFYPENGRLLRVYAEGQLWADSLYKQKLPDPAVVQAGRQAVRAERLAQTQYQSASQAAEAAATAANKLPKGSKARSAAAQKANDQKAFATTQEEAWQRAQGRAQGRSADTLVQNLPAWAPDGDRVTTRHKPRSLGPIRFTNGQTSIDLNTAATDKNLDLLVADRNTDYPPRGVRFLDLVSVVHTSGRRLMTDNVFWTLRPDGTTSHRLTAGGGLNDLFEVALYTDLLSTLNNEDNGLISTEVASWLPLHPRPFKRNGNLFWGTAVRPYLALTRLDSKFDSLRLNAQNYIDRPNLLQRSYLRFGLNLNLLTLDTRGHVTAQLNTSWTRTATRVAGAVGTADTARRNVYQNLYGLELLATVRRQRNFGADLYFTVYLHNVESRRPIENTGAEWALRPGALFYYYPFGSPANKLFFRVSNYIFPQGRQRDFVQLQVGYAIGIGSLLGNGGPGGAVPTAASGAHLPGQ